MMLSPTGPATPSIRHAEVAELADALDSKSSVPKGRVGSSPTFGNPYRAMSCNDSQMTLIWLELLVMVAKW